MQKRTPRFAESQPQALSVADLEAHGRGWIHDGEGRQLSERTLDTRRDLIAKLVWFLRQEERPTCGRAEIRAFLAYVSRGHERPGGRWGKADDRRVATRVTRAVKPRTVKDYFVNLRTLFAFLVAEEVIDAHPMENMSPPIAREDQIQPFSPDQILDLLEAAKRSRYRLRDEALVLFLLDTGARASEVCGVTVADLDFRAHCCRVLGKGNKERTVYFGRKTSRALWAYIHATGSKRPDGGRLFLAESGKDPGEPMTRFGVDRRIETLGKVAGIQGVRCSPHTCRHTCALRILQGGGDPFALQVMLGHTSLTVTRRYIALADADVSTAHQRASPVDGLFRKKR